MGTKKKKKEEKKNKKASIDDAQFSGLCEQLWMKYLMLGKEEWWWIMDDSIELIADRLKDKGYVYIDRFVLQDQWRQFQLACAKCFKDDQLKPGGLVNAKKSMDEAAYHESFLRSDYIGWFKGDNWPYGDNLKNFELKINTLVTELTPHIPELKKISCRSHSMIACYPGNGTRYSKHFDSDGKHPLCVKRVLTALMYLNDWNEGDGGELVVYDTDMNERARVPPLGGRVLLFWSDKRTPHEVLPSRITRFSVTAWMLDNTVGLPVPGPVENPNEESMVNKSSSSPHTDMATDEGQLVVRNASEAVSSSTESTMETRNTETTSSSAEAERAAECGTREESGMNPTNAVSPPCGRADKARASAESDIIDDRQRSMDKRPVYGDAPFQLSSEGEDVLKVTVDDEKCPVVEQSDTHVCIQVGEFEITFKGQTKSIRYSKKKKTLSLGLDAVKASGLLRDIEVARKP